MNKFKKMAVMATSLVMAGTMVFGFTACDDDDDIGGGGGNTVTLPEEVNPKEDVKITDNDKYGVLHSNGGLNYKAYERDSEVTLNLAIGHNSLTTSTSFRDLAASITLPDGNSYSDGRMKPAWTRMGADLNIKWNDVYQGKATNANLKSLLTDNISGSSQKQYSRVDMFTTDLSEAVTYSGTADILNLGDYLDYMPNFSKFLNENPVVYLSLLQDGMNTTTGEGKNILIAPYFDGYNDIERYCLVRHDWVKKLLNVDSSAPVTLSTEKYKDICKEVAQAYMGSTEYEVDCLTSDGSTTQTIKKEYSKAATAAKDETKPLGAAYKAIANEVYGGTSGNIVDIMNAALAKNANATGAQLVALYRAYIDVCYTKGGAAYFSDSNRANVFVGYDACWDVDDLVAMLRCVKTNASVLVDKEGGYKTIGGIMPRTGEYDRTTDIVSLICQLYGVGGGTSRNEFTYIDKDGNIKDARAHEDIYNACANFNLLYKEGLVANYSSTTSFKGASGIVGDTEYFMEYDYSQTQTLAGFLAENSGITHKDFGHGAPDTYYFAPVITPIAKWDVNADGSITADEYFRFTESWRATKTSGLALNGSLKNDAAKLKAAIQFVDYLYSDDGQLISTFGPKATNAEGAGGFWYNTEATAAEITDGKYFTYKGVKYSGSEYKGNYTPTITANLYNSFIGKTVNGWKVGDNDKVKGAALSFTNYARMLIGSTLPVGVKDQSFENQLTSKMGQAGAGIVGQALAKGVVKGLSLNIDENNYWFTCVPTSLPTSTGNQNTLDNSNMANFKYLTGTKKGDSKGFLSIFNWIVLNGTNSTYAQQDVTVSYTSVSDLLSKTLGTSATIGQLASQRELVWNQAWTTAKGYWNYLKPAK